MKNILIVLSEYGFWGEELVGPLEVLEERGYKCDFMTPNGVRPRALPVSMDTTFNDPPLDRCVTNEYYAQKTKEIDESDRLKNPISLAGWFPERPYFSAQNYLRELEKYNDAVDAAQAELEKYDALLLVGGSGPIVDMVNNQRLHDVILGFYKMNKPIAAECYGVTCLAFARDWYTRESIIAGKHVTGHPLEYDYHDGTGFFDAAKGDWVDFNMGPPPYPLEHILRDATKPGGAYHSGVGRKISALVDYPFITSRSTASSRKCGELMVEVLENGMKSYGW
ncbi:MAG: type 1 glutamine amidotransferase domain-containing protein [Ectothiorhodospiraceae bacterium]|nr:type 1 glutamine amidotransferase domain-containing protein [Ectothiorhodospiraceae bacterium]